MEPERDNDSDELKIGIKVRNEDEAYKLYCEYALKKGFSVRKGNIRHSTGGIVRQREYLCANAGHYHDGEPYDPKKIKRLVRRTGCKAFIRFTIINSVWEISHFSDEHNHEFIVPEERNFLRINRNVSPASTSVINSRVDVGLRETKAYSHLPKEVVGSENVAIKVDHQNFKNHERLKLIERWDAQSVLNYFKHCLVEDLMFFHSEELDKEGRLANFFWRDGRSKFDYDCFGDVVVFDTTYRMNKYDMVFAPFVGVNHHRKNILFGCALLLDETEDTFVWLLETFLEAMGNQPPKTIFTDQCQAMTYAIHKVFPNTCHRLCSWYILENATKKIEHLSTNFELSGVFHECLNSETEEEFESTWHEMITRFDLAGNEWLQSLYELREKWCPAFNLDIFTLHVNSSNWSEGISNVLDKMSCKAITLREFVHHYEEQCKKIRLDERNDDFSSECGSLQIKIKGSNILKQAASIYTGGIYYLFEDEFLSSLIVHLELFCSLDTLHTYRVFEEGHTKYYVTKFDSCNENVSCSCKLFESTGWLCRHALKVLNVWNFTRIPSKYILNRWTKYAKKGTITHNHGELSTQKKSSLTVDRNILHQQSYHAINQLVLTDEGKNVAKEKIEEMWVEAKRLVAVYNVNKGKDGFVDGNVIRA